VLWETPHNIDVAKHTVTFYLESGCIVVVGDEYAYIEDNNTKIET
jgi:hypothetical protein